MGANRNIYTAENGFRFVLYDVLGTLQRPERKAIVKNYFYENTINLIYGQSGHCKTWWALYEAICFVLGDKLLDLDIEEDDPDYPLPHKVLYVSLEMTARDIGDRINKLCMDLTLNEKKKVLENLVVVSFEDTWNMIARSGDFLDALGELCNSRDGGFDIVYIDSFTDYIVGYDERSEDQMRSVISALREFTVNYFVSLRIIHHGTKTYSDGSGGAMAGIHTIRDLVDCVLSVKQKGDELTITNDQTADPSAKTRYNKPITLLAGIRSDDETGFSFYPKMESEKSDNVAMIAEIMLAVSKKQGITAGELKKEVKNLNVRLRDSMVGTDLKVHTEKTGHGGHDTKRFYTVDYYNDHRDEIEGRADNGTTVVQRLSNGRKPLQNSNRSTVTTVN